jgi:UDP-glucose 4-epimerase
MSEGIDAAPWLVTGASGQVGTALLRELDVPVWTSSRRMPRLAPRHHLGHTTLALDDTAAIREAATHWRDVATLVLLAARITTSTSVAELTTQLRTELFANAHLVESLPGLRRVVFASSCTVYGTTRAEPLHERDPVDPRSVYAIGKVANEEALAILCRARGVTCVSLRIAQVYGPTSPPTEIVRRFIDTARGGGTIRVNCGLHAYRDYVHEDDVARAIRLAVASRDSAILNVGAGRATTIADLARTAASAAGDPQRALITDEASTYSMVMDCSLAAARIGYTPRHDVLAWIREAVGAPASG